jgi:hypothetical protein
VKPVVHGIETNLPLDARVDIGDESESSKAAACPRLSHDELRIELDLQIKSRDWLRGVQVHGHYDSCGSWREAHERDADFRPGRG